MKSHRNPKHHQTLIMNSKNYSFSRAKLRKVPTDYSDLVRSDVVSKSWKNNKKSNQWK